MTNPLDPKAQLIDRIKSLANNACLHSNCFTCMSAAEAIASAWAEDLEKARREVEGKFRCDYCGLYQHPKDMRATYGSDAKVTGRICDTCVQKAMAALNKSKDQ